MADAILTYALVGWLIACVTIAIGHLCECRRRPRSGTHIMPVVKLPEGYEPPSAAVITPHQFDGGSDA